MSTSTAVAVVAKQPAEDAKAEKIPAASSLVVPAAIMLAAESVAMKPGGGTPSLEGVRLHAKGEKGRVVATDGVRMFIASFALPSREEGGAPPWMWDGVTLSVSNLRARLQLLGKLSGEPGVVVTYAAGNAAAELSDEKASTVLKVPVLGGAYPDYERTLGAKSFIDLDADGQQENRDWQPVGINSTYLKQCGDIAKTLEAGLGKSQRSKLGMVVRAFNGGAADAPLVFDFSTWPGAVLVVAPVLDAKAVTSKETAQILAPALKMTVAALRAHATRWDQRAVELPDGPGKQAAAAKAAEFRSRVAAILALVPAGPAIGASKAEKAAAAGQQPDPKPTVAAEDPEPSGTAAAAGADDEAASPQPEPEDDGEAAGQTAKPKTKRTRIKVPNSHHATH